MYRNTTPEVDKFLFADSAGKRRKTQNRKQKKRGEVAFTAPWTVFLISGVPKGTPFADQN
jgi:hypothetical protein